MLKNLENDDLKVVNPDTSETTDPLNLAVETIGTSVISSITTEQILTLDRAAKKLRTRVQTRPLGVGAEAGKGTAGRRLRSAYRQSGEKSLSLKAWARQNRTPDVGTDAAAWFALKAQQFKKK